MVTLFVRGVPNDGRGSPGAAVLFGEEVIRGGNGGGDGRSPFLRGGPTLLIVKEYNLVDDHLYSQHLTA